MAHHLLSKEEQLERDRKIAGMAERGCAYSDIARRYGLATGSITKIVERYDASKSVKNTFGGPESWGRACYLDGVR